ncbi:MAG: hypothetical protein KC550_04215 [Nanoarchaeota archaeon]|nr:hypothetical protein [Nanoarchaeota archaeon]
MEFWKCLNCAYKSKFNVLICPNCTFKLDLFIPNSFKVIEMTKVFLPSRKHQIVPYNVLLLKDEYGNYYPKKTMQNYHIGDNYDIKKTNFNIVSINHVSINSDSAYIHKHKNSLYADIKSIFKYTYLENGIFDVNDSDVNENMSHAMSGGLDGNGGVKVEDTNFENYLKMGVSNFDIVIKVSDWIENSGAVEFKLYLDFLNEIVKSFFEMKFKSNQIKIVFSLDLCPKLLKKLKLICEKLELQILDVSDLDKLTNKLVLINLAQVSQVKTSFLASSDNLKNLNLKKY